MTNRRLLPTRPLAARTAPTAAAPAVPAQSRPSAPLDPQQQALLAFLVRYRAATPAVLALYLGVGEPAARARADRLAKRGLVKLARPGGLALGVYVATRKGRVQSGTGLGEPSGGDGSVALGTLLHTLAVAAYGATCERQGRPTRTEREIRQADMPRPVRLNWPAAPQWAVATNVGGGRHYPDLVLTNDGDGSGPLTAIEVERTVKSDAELRRVLRAYRDARHVGQVVYLTDARPVAEAVKKAAADVGLTAIRILHWPKDLPPLR